MINEICCHASICRYSHSARIQQCAARQKGGPFINIHELKSQTSLPLIEITGGEPAGLAQCSLEKNKLLAYRDLSSQILNLHGGNDGPTACLESLMIDANPMICVVAF